VVAGDGGGGEDTTMVVGFRVGPVCGREVSAGTARSAGYVFRCDAVNSWPSDTSWSYLTFVLCRSFIERTQNISYSRLIEHSLLVVSKAIIQTLLNTHARTWWIHWDGLREDDGVA
jgi:hypothetical protein